MAQAPTSRELAVVFSRSENAEGLAEFVRMTRIANSKSRGSALKYGLLAAAECDVFPRLAGSSERDTAAGQPALEASGGFFIDWDTGMSLRCGKALRRNPRLLTFRSRHHVENFFRQEYRTVIS